MKGNNQPPRRPVPAGMFPFVPEIGQRPPSPKPIKFDQMIKPMADLILVERIYVGQGDLMVDIPQELVEKQTTAIVVAVGDGRITDWGVTIYPCCKVGDRVFVPPGQGFPVEVQGRNMFLVPNNQIIAIIPPEAPSPATDALQSTEAPPPSSVSEATESQLTQA